MTGHKLLVVGAVLALTGPAWAQPPDEPGRGVARISVMNGDVSVRRGDSGDYVAAALNAPLVVQDRVLTGASSRAEVQFDWANFLRLSHNAEIRLAELEWRRYMVQLARGTVTWRVLRDQDAYIEISTPSVSVRPVRKGTYRVTVLDDGSSEITVRSGEVEIFTPRGSERLRSGRTMFARGTVSDPEFRVGEEIPEDEWDRWNVARDRDLERSRSYEYMSRDIYGAEDLDHHGRWVHVASYGWVWSPRVAVGWAPYRHGRWAWMDWYGWSWVSYDPWGWAPYHYGRWFYHAPVGWCWWPGSIGVRHYWSPGFVAFVGFGRVGVGVGFGWGRVGWIPLAPYEPYHPWYGRRWYGGYRNRGGYVDNSVTVVNNVNVTNIYRNSRIDNAVTVVDNDNFRRGRFNDTIRVSTDEIRTASLARGPVPVTPERDSLRLTDREASVRGVERAGGERFFSNRRPAEVERVSFDDQRRGIEQIARRNFGGDDTARTAVVEGGRTATDGSRGERTAEQRGWRRAGESERGASASGVRPAEATGRSFSSEERGAGSVRGADAGERGASVTNDWRRFGSPRVESSDAARGAADAGARGTSSGDDWRRFGSPRIESNDASRGAGDAGARGISSGDDWRRFGSPRVESNDATRGFGSARGAGEPAAPRAADSTGERGVSSDDWRRFGSGRVAEGASSEANRGSVGRAAEAPERGVSSEGWRRFEGSRSESSGTDFGSGRSPAPERGIGDWRRGPEPSGRSMEAPRMERRDWGGSRGMERSGGDSIRISPPIVRERGDFGGGRSFEGPRSAPGGGMRGGDGGGSVRGSDGGGRAAPSGGPSGGGRGADGGGGRSGGRGR